MERVLKGLQWKTVLVCLNHMIMFGGTLEQGLERLEEIFRRFRASTSSSATKSVSCSKGSAVPWAYRGPGWGMSRLSQGCSSKGVARPEEREGGAEFSECLHILQEIRIKDYTSIAALLQQMTKGELFRWDAKCQAAFDQMKGALVDAPVVHIPTPAGHSSWTSTPASRVLGPCSSRGRRQRVRGGLLQPEV